MSKGTRILRCVIKFIPFITIVLLLCIAFPWLWMIDLCRWCEDDTSGCKSPIEFAGLNFLMFNLMYKWWVS
jgi:hypothetical protein